jgi:AcrR family transcriptional regulator
VKVAKKPGRKTGPQTEARILREATDMFAHYGFDATSIRMIADKAGVTLPTIYLYFADKRELYLSCCLDVFKASSAAVIAADDDTLPPAERVYVIVREIAHQLIENKNLTKLFQREILDADMEGLALLDRDAFVASFSRLEQLVSGIIGPLPPLKVLSVFALSFGFAQYMQGAMFTEPDLSPGPDRPDRLAQHVMRITLPEIYEQLPLALHG